MSFTSQRAHPNGRRGAGGNGNDARTQSEDVGRGVHGRHARGLRRDACVSRAGGLAQNLRRDGDPHQDQAAARPQRGDRGLYGRRLRPRLRQARHLHGAGDRRAQSRRRLARRLARPFPGDRVHRRPRAEDQVPPRLSGGRRRAGVRAGHQVERHGRRREPLSRHGAAGVPRRHHRHARAGASAVSRQRRPGRRRRRRDGADGRAGVFARAAVPAGAGSGERAGGGEGSAKRGAAGDRRRWRRARVGRGARAGGAGGGAANSGRDLAQRQGLDHRQSSAVMRRGRHLFAREREQGGERGRSHLLRRLNHRRHDHALLGGAQDRHAGDPDRHQPRGARPELSAAGPRQRRRQGDAFEDAGGLRQVHRRQAQGLGRAGAVASSRNGTPSTSRCWSRTRCRSIRRASATNCRSMCRTTPSSWSTPATPACGWAACTICAPTRRAICGAPAISAGRFRRGSAPSAARRIARW